MIKSRILKGMQLRKLLDNGAVTFFRVAATLLVLQFVVLGYYCYWADSEIWGMALARRLFIYPNENISVFFKPLFYFVLRLPYSLNLSNIEIFLFDRFLFSLLGIAIVYLTWDLTRRIFRDQIAAYCAAILLLGSTLFLNQGFRVRSDFLSLFFHLLFYREVLSYVTAKTRQSPRKLGIKLFLWNLGTLLATPKAVFYLAAQTAFALLLCFQTDKTKRRDYFWAVFLPAAFPLFIGADFLLISILFSMKGLENPVFLSYYSAFTYFKDAFAARQSFDLSSERFHYLMLFVERNVELVAIFLPPLILAPFAALGRRTIDTVTAFRFSVIVLLAGAATYNDFLPFFLAALLPPLVISSAGFILEFVRTWATALRFSGESFALLRNLCVFLITCFTLIKAGLFFTHNLLENNNLEQRAAIHLLERYLASYPKATHYDVVGLLPKNNQIYKFLGPGQDWKNQKVFDFLTERKPDFIIYVRKMLLIDSFMSRFLRENYVHLGRGVYGRALALDRNSLGRERELEGKSYRVVPQSIREQIHDLFTGAPELSAILLYPEEQEGELARAGGTSLQAVNGLRSEKTPLIRLRHLELEDEVLIPDLPGEWKISVYPTVDLRNERHFMFLFAFDSAF